MGWLEVQNQFSSCCGWVLSTLEFWTCIRSDSKVSWRSVVFQVFPSFFSPLFILKVLTISPIALQFSSSSLCGMWVALLSPLRTISEKNPDIPITRSGFASVALSRMGLFLHCRGRLGLNHRLVFFFFWGGEQIFKLKITTWNKQGWTFEKSPVDSWVFSNCIFSRFHFAPTPPAGASVEYLGWGDCNGHLDTGFPIRIISGWMMFWGETHMRKRCKTPFLAHIKFIDYIFILWMIFQISI